jgi:DNA modification methylase
MHSSAQVQRRTDDEKRGYAGFNAKYPAKSEYKRRTAVWTDICLETDIWPITEVMRGKVHECEKPAKLLEKIVNTHSNEGDMVLDLFSESGSAAIACQKLGRYFVSVEECRKDYLKIIERLR